MGSATRKFPHSPLCFIAKFILRVPFWSFLKVLRNKFHQLRRLQVSLKSRITESSEAQLYEGHIRPSPLKGICIETHLKQGTLPCSISPSPGEKVNFAPPILQPPYCVPGSYPRGETDDMCIKKEVATNLMHWPLFLITAENWKSFASVKAN